MRTAWSELKVRNTDYDNIENIAFPKEGMKHVVYVWARQVNEDAKFELSSDEEAKFEEPRVVVPFQEPIYHMVNHLVKRAASMPKIPKEDSKQKFGEGIAQKLFDLWMRAVDCAIFEQVKKGIVDSWDTFVQTRGNPRQE